MSTAISYENWSEFLFKLGAVCGPAELQGMVVGSLCAGARWDEATWLDTAFRFMDLPQRDIDADQSDAIAALYEMTLATLRDDNYGLRLILPEDQLSLVRRSESLGLWCQGFLHGLGAAQEELGTKLDADSQDALRDLAQIANLNVEEEESEENEVYFAELVEYVRVAVLSLFAELNPRSTSDPSIH